MAVAIAVLMLIGQSATTSSQAPALPTPVSRTMPPPMAAPSPASRRGPAPPGPRTEENRWITPDDYPSRSLREGAEGSVYMVLSISPFGRVEACGIAQSSGHDSLDQAACLALVRRARYWPAIDRRERPRAAQLPFVVRWRLPDEEPPRPALPPPLPNKWNLPDAPLTGAAAATAPMVPPPPPALVPPAPVSTPPPAVPVATAALRPARRSAGPNVVPRLRNDPAILFRPDAQSSVVPAGTRRLPMVLLSISARGRVDQCRLVSAGIGPMADELCTRLSAARWYPARDARGRAVPGRLYAAYQWTSPPPPATR